MSGRVRSNRFLGRGVKCLAQRHKRTEVGLGPLSCRSGVGRSTTGPLRPQTGTDQPRSNLSFLYLEITAGVHR